MDIGPIYYERRFSIEEANELLAENLAVDGSMGGLVLGPSHEDGGIYMLINYGDCYKLMGEMEGYEYLFNVAIGYLTRNSIDDINNHKRDERIPFIEYEFPSTTQVVDARNEQSPTGSKFILMEGRGFQRIVNKHSTKLQLSVLDDANKRYFPDFAGQSYLSTKYFNIIDRVDNRILDKVHMIVNPDLYWKHY